MSKRTWICVPCRKSYRRVKSTTSLECPSCHEPCVYAERVSGIPSPKRPKEWDAFWARYKLDADMQQEAERVLQASAVPNRQRTMSTEKRTGYVEVICTPLIKTLNHSSGLPANQLAGHAANVDFWISEAEHCLAVIDGYQERFDRLRTGQAEYEKLHDVASKVPLRGSSKYQKRQELRRAVCEGIERFLTRCHTEDFLTARELKARLASFRT